MARETYGATSPWELTYRSWLMVAEMLVDSMAMQKSPCVDSGSTPRLWS